MRCAFCHNPDTWDPSGNVQYTMSPEELFKETMRYESFIRRGGVTCTGGEPLVQARFVAEYFRLCRNAGLHTALDTSGAVGLDVPFVKEAVEQSDLVMLDIKTLDDSLHKDYVGMERTNNKAFMEYLQSIGKPVWIRHVVVPGITYDHARLEALARYVSGFSVVERVELLGYHTMGAYKYESLGIPYRLKDVPALDSDALEAARAIFRGIVPCKVC